MRYDRQILGYHGCDEAVAQLLLAGEEWKPSKNKWDWLGGGVYFWEYGLQRARRWAENEAKKPGGKVKAPAVVGAVIQLGNCFDLLDVGATAALGEAYEIYKASAGETKSPLPTNAGSIPDMKLRDLDCAVINFFLEAAEEQNAGYDTVRCAFQEGGPAFEGSGISQEGHIQVTVRNLGCVLGVFRPRL